MSEAFDLDREQNIENNIDATGKKWVIHKDRTNHLLYARPEPDRADAVIPKRMRGQWTKMMLLKEQIALHVKDSWDQADAAAARKARSEQAVKELDKKIEEDEKQTPEESIAAMPYDQLLMLAKEAGIESRKKAEIIEALTKTED